MDDLGEEQFCYLRTAGRVTGNPHTIEIWFGLRDGTAYLLAGGRESADWVRNLVADPAVHVRIGDHELAAHARVVPEGPEADAARELLYAKYQPGYDGELADWRDTALPVAIDLEMTTH